jgi:hypothetical protein
MACVDRLRCTHVQYVALTGRDLSWSNAHVAVQEEQVEALIAGILRRADEAIRGRLSQYMRALVESGASADLLVICANEFIKEQSDHDKRYTGL